MELNDEAAAAAEVERVTSLLCGHLGRSIKVTEMVAGHPVLVQYLLSHDTVLGLLFILYYLLSFIVF